MGLSYAECLALREERGEPPLLVEESATVFGRLVEARDLVVVLAKKEVGRDQEPAGSNQSVELLQIGQTAGGVAVENATS